jgi:AcrR family transcriptional regulator
MSPRNRANGRQAEKSEAAMAQALESALELFSTQGYGATSMRRISDHSGLSVGNLYHHFGSKEAIFQELIDEYLDRLGDPDNPLQQVFQRAAFPDDLEEMATAIGRVVEQNAAYIKLIYVDFIEFEGRHIRIFYEGMADAFADTYSASLEEKSDRGEFGEIDPLAAVMFATRWFFYFFLMERCFGVPMHLGMTEHQAVDEFIKILRLGVLPRSVPVGTEPAAGARAGRT